MSAGCEGCTRPHPTHVVDFGDGGASFVVCADCAALVEGCRYVRVFVLVPHQVVQS